MIIERKMIMGSNPKLRVGLEKIRDNASKVVELCKKTGIRAGGVTKGLCGNLKVAEAMVDGGCFFLADSRVKNIANLKREGVNSPFVLLRLPMPSETDAVVTWADVSLVSMAETILLLDEACKIQNKFHEVIVMVDVGDLREGIWPSDVEIETVASALKKCKRVHCLGVGTNVGCYGGVLPSRENMGRLVEVGRKLEDLLGYKLAVYSGGSSSSLALIEKGEMPREINQLRIGEAILLGTDVTGGRKIPYLNQDTMFLEAEVIEVRRKPSVPVGEIGADAFGNVPFFEDRGVRLRAVLALGKQDVRLEGIKPLQNGIRILGASSDHMIVDVEDCDENISPGSVLAFRVDYGAMLAAATSPYVEVVADAE